MSDTGINVGKVGEKSKVESSDTISGVMLQRSKSSNSLTSTGNSGTLTSSSKTEVLKNVLDRTVSVNISANKPIHQDKVNEFDGLKNGVENLTLKQDTPVNQAPTKITVIELPDAKVELNYLENRDPKSAFIKEKYSLTDFLNNPKISKAFDDFAKKNKSFENVAFLHSAQKVLDKGGGATLKDIANVYFNFIDSKSSMPLKNIDPINNRLALKIAIDSKDTVHAMRILKNIMPKATENLSATFSKFKDSPEFKSAIKQNSLNLPQNTLNSSGKLIERMPTSNENGEFTKYIGVFKKDMGLEGNKLEPALSNLGKALALSPEKGKEQLKAFDSLKLQVDKFLDTPANVKSPNIKLVQAFKESISFAKTEINEKFVTTEPGKLNALNEGVGKLINSANPKTFENIKLKVTEFLKNDPKGDLAWAVTMLPEDKAKKEISLLVGKSFNTFLKPRLNAKITDEIYNGLKDALPIKANGSRTIILNNVEYKKDQGKPLGIGNFGVVCKYVNNKGDAIVVKEFKREELFDNPKSIDNDFFDKEAEAHRLVSGKTEYEHPNVTTFIGAFKDSTGRMCTVQEFANGGDLTKLMDKLNEFKNVTFKDPKSGKEIKVDILSPKDDILVRQYLAKGIVEGMVHVNETRNMMHLDIKPDNFLFDKKTCTVKVADFGLTEKNKKLQEARGTLDYEAPEVSGNKVFDKKSDVWGVGLTINELMSGKKTFLGSYIITEKNLEGLKNEKVGEKEIINFLKPLLNKTFNSKDDFMNELSKLKNEDKSELKLTEDQKELVMKHTFIDFVSSGDKFSKVKDPNMIDIGESTTAYGKALNSMIVVDTDKRTKISELKNSPFITDPVGSDERAQALIKSMLDVLEKKKTFEDVDNKSKEIEGFKKDIVDYENKIIEAEKLKSGKSINEINEQITNTNGNIEKIEEMIRTNSNQIRKTEESIEVEKDEIKQNEIYLKGSISSADIDGLHKDISKSKSVLGELETKLTGQKEKLGKLETELSGLRKELLEHQKERNAPENIETYRGEIKNLNENISGLDTKLSKLKEEFKDVTTFDMKAEFQKLEKQFSNLV